MRAGGRWRKIVGPSYDARLLSPAIMNYTRASKFMSLILRHDPSAAGITLDSAGWADLAALLDGMGKHGYPITRDNLDAIVREDAKQRYAISEDGLRIRANQGHSIEVDVGFEEMTPPEMLYHGTGEKSVATILRDGLKKMARHHVHLSIDEPTALTVGKRHGRPVIFRIAAGEMAKRGVKFYRSANGVWLVDSVPPEHLSAIEQV
jgi:putative RNA 2'-phosphotransferase